MAYMQQMRNVVRYCAGGGNKYLFIAFEKKNIMSTAIRSKVIRIFISSTFEDMRKERDVLQQKVYPYLLALCAPRGWQIDFVDLRWGISKEAGVQQKTMRICIEELERCKKVSPRPNFLILQGQRYGWRPLPEVIDASHWGALTRLAAEMGVREVLDRWYRRDDNGYPPVYVMRSKADFPGEGYDSDFVKYEREVERPLRAVMVAYAERRTDLDEAGRAPFIASATEQEILHGALSKNVVPQQVAAFIRTIGDLDYDAPDEPLLDDLEQRAYARSAIASLKRRIETQLASNEGSICHCDVSAEHYHSPEYLALVERQLKELLEGLVRHEMDEYERVKLQPWEEEVYRQEAFVSLRTRFFQGREEILERMLAFPLSRERLFCLEGLSGSGKSSVMAEAYRRMRASGDRIVLFRSVGEGNSTSGQIILCSLLQELRYRYHVDLGDVELEKMPYGELVEVSNRLMYNYIGRPIVIMIDALDQLPLSDPMRSFGWLPLDAQGDVRAIVSRIVDGNTGPLPSRCTYTLHNMRDEGIDNARRILLDNLSASQRTLSERQQEVVLDAFARGGFQPIFLKLIAGIAADWRADDEVEIDNVAGYSETILTDGRRRITIPTGEAQLVAGFFRLMAGTDRHGRIVLNVLAFIYFTRRGIADGEIRQLLALDEDFMDYFRKHSYHDFKPVVDAFPSILWTRLYYDIRFLLSEHVVTGGAVNNFNHRQVHEGARMLLEESGYDREKVFCLLTSYFGERNRLGDSRALEELPRVLKKSGRNEEQAQLLLDIDFIQNKAQRGLIFDLVSDFQVAIATLRQIVLTPLSDDDIEVLRSAATDPPRRAALLDRAVLARYQDRLQAVEDFLVKELAQFVDFAVENRWFTLQLFYNAYQGGPLDFMADRYMEHAGSVLPEMYLRLNRPPYDDHPLLLQKLAGHSWCITSLAVSSNGERVVTASDDRQCKVWDMAHFRVLQSFFGHQAQVSALAVNDTFSHAYSGSWDGCVLHWDIASALELEPGYVPSKAAKVLALVIDPRGGCRAGYSDGHCRWIVAGKEQASHNLGSPVTALALCANHLYAGLDDGRLFDITDPLATAQEVCRLRDGIRTIAFCKGNIWVSCADGTVMAVDLATSRATRLLAFDTTDKVNPADYCFTLSAEGNRMAVVRDLDIILVERPASKDCTQTVLKGHSKDAQALHLTADGSRLYSGGRDRRLMLWNLDNLQWHHQEEDLQQWFGKVVYLSRQTSRMEVVATSLNGRIVKWGSKETQGTLVADGLGALYSIDVSPDGHTAICSAGDGSIRLVDLDQPENTSLLPSCHSTFVNAVRFSPDGRYAVSNAIDEEGAGEGTVLALWDIATRSVLQRYTEVDLTGHAPWRRPSSEADEGINQQTGRYRYSRLADAPTIYNIIYINGSHGVVFSPDGRYVAVACRDGNVAILDPFSRRVLRRLGVMYDRQHGQSGILGHTNEVKSVVFSSDGRYLYSSSWDNSVIIWDLQRPVGEEYVIRLEGHRRGIYALDIAADDKTLVSGANDRTFIIWNISKAMELSQKGKKSADWRDDVVINRVVTPANCNSVAFTRDGVVAGLEAGGVMITENSKGETLHDVPIVTAVSVYDAATGITSPLSVCCPCCGRITRIEAFRLPMSRRPLNLDDITRSCPHCHNMLQIITPSYPENSVK